MALRDTCIARDESLKTGRSLNLWLQVLQQEAFTDPVCSAASMVLHSFLVTQTQSATCERTFARVEGLKILCCGLLGCFRSVLDNNYLVNRGGNTHTHTHLVEYACRHCLPTTSKALMATSCLSWFLQGNTWASRPRLHSSSRVWSSAQAHSRWRRRRLILFVVFARYGHRKNVAWVPLSSSVIRVCCAKGAGPKGRIVARNVLNTRWQGKNQKDRNAVCLKQIAWLWSHRPKGVLPLQFLTQWALLGGRNRVNLANLAANERLSKKKLFSRKKDFFSISPHSTISRPQANSSTSSPCKCHDWLQLYGYAITRTFYRFWFKPTRSQFWFLI